MPATRPSCALPDLPRASWTTHPNYPTQALLLNGHAHFRTISRALRERADTVAQQLADGSATSPSALAERLTASLVAFHQWTRMMRSHEHYEEHKLYPYLAHRYGLSTAQMEGEHASLHQTGDAVSTAFLEAIVGLSGSDTTSVHAAHEAVERLQEALRAHDMNLLEHLEHEEDTVIPLLLHLPREEFRRYYEGHIATLLKESTSCADQCEAQMRAPMPSGPS
ncbi:MAG: hypothetical protein AAFS10_22905 [Myxococcota bacterium]